MRRILSALSALLLSGCGLLYAEVEIPKIEVTLPQESFPGTAAGGSLSKDFTYDLGSDISVITDNDVTVVLKLQSLSIASATDLYPVQSVSVVVVPPAGSLLPEVALVDYLRPTGAVSPVHDLQAASSSDADLGPYLTAGTLTLRASASGALPASGWLGDVTADFYLKVRYPYGKQIKL
jgi:hypothetical protein